MTKPEVDRLPLYIGFILLGAISPDHERLRMSERDQALYQMALHKKRAQNRG